MKVIKNWYHPLLIAGVLLMMTSSCKKEYLKNPATVTTALASKVTALTLDPSTVVTVVGNITDDGGSAVTERGVCYNVISLNASVDMEKDPTLDYCTQKISANVTSKQFSVKVSVVTSGIYILRAYAITRGGVAYGNSVSFQIGSSGGAGASVKELKSTQEEVSALKKKVEEHGTELVKKINEIDFRALSNTLADLKNIDESKINKVKTDLEELIKKKLDSADLDDFNSAIGKLLAAKLNSVDFVNAKNILESLINTKANAQDLVDAKTALKSLIDVKASTQDLTDAKAALQLLINTKASTQDLTDAKAALQLLINTKASTQDLTDAKAALQLLINTKASTQDLTDAKAALQLLIDAKASQSDLNAATRRLSQIERIIMAINPISSLAITDLSDGKATISISLDHISINPSMTKPFTEIEKLEYVCFETNRITPLNRIAIPFDPNAVADNVTEVDIPLNLTSLDAGRSYKFIVYATKVGGGRPYSSRVDFTAR